MGSEGQQKLVEEWKQRLEDKHVELEEEKTRHQQSIDTFTQRYLFFTSKHLIG